MAPDLCFAFHSFGGAERVSECRQVCLPHRVECGHVKELIDPIGIQQARYMTADWIIEEYKSIQQRSAVPRRH